MAVPTDLTGLTVWLDASQLTQADGVSIGTQWSDLSGGGHHGAVVNSPAPVVKTNALNGNRVVRFAYNSGCIRGTGMCADGSSDLTVFYVGRMWGSNVGRIFTNTYPPYNVLIGTHTIGEPVMYDNGWIGPQPGWSGTYPTPWKIYGAVCTSTADTFYVNGGVQGTGGAGAGHDNRWNISGYDATGSQETCDCEIAELITYNRALSDSERISVENYLAAKWFPLPLDDFNRANSTTSAGTNWTNRLNTVGISGNAAYGVSGGWNVASYNTPASTDDMEASITLGAYGGTDNAVDYSLVMIGANAAGEAVLVLNSPALSGFVIFTQSAWDLTGLTQQANIGGTWVAGDTIKLKRAGNVYTVYKNDSTTGLTWTDSTNIVPRDSSHRTVAMGSYDGGTGSRRINSFDASPVTTSAPTPVSAALTGAGVLSATAFASYLRAAALTGAGALSATTVKVAPASAVLAGAGTLSATTVKVAPVSAALAGAGAFSGSAIIPVSGRILPATGSLSAIIAIGTGVYPDVTGAGALSAVPTPVVPQAASLTGSGVLSVTTKRSILGPLIGAGVLATSTAQIYIKQPALAGGGTLADPTFYGTGFKSMDTSGTGTVSATWMARPFVYPALVGPGALAATLGMQYLFTPALVGDGALSEVHGQIYPLPATLSSNGVLGGDNNMQIYALAPGPSGDGVLSATAVRGFNPFNEENINRTNQAVPASTAGCWVSLIGGGGGGGTGYGSATTGSGGGGGGGAARTARVFIPVANLGATYSVTRGLGGTSAAAGQASTFSSGTRSLTAGGGGKGGNGGSGGIGSGGTAGTAGAASQSNVSATLFNGTAGGAGGISSANGAAGVNNTNGAGAGGGGGAGNEPSTTHTAGKGGNSATVTGANGNADAANAAAGNGGAGGGGGQGDGGDFGGGGGGGTARDSGGAAVGGIGGDGYTLVEWV